MVDFTLTDEQRSLREMAHDFAVKEIRPVAWEYDKEGTWPQDVIEKAWEVGLMNSHIEEAYGGAGADSPPPIRLMPLLFDTMPPRITRVMIRGPSTDSTSSLMRPSSSSSIEPSPTSLTSSR